MNQHPYRLLAIGLIAFLLSLPAQSQNQPTPPRALLALSKTDHVLAIVDPSTLKVIARIPVGSDPHEVIASEDGKTAYVTIYGGGSLHEINIIDLVGQKPISTLDTRPLYGPHGITFVNGKVWFTTEGSKTVGRYDPTTGKIDWAMGTGQDRTHMIYVTADGKKVYTTNVSSGTVSILQDTLLPPGRMGPPPGGPGGNQSANAPGNGNMAGGPPNGGAPGNGNPPPGPPNGGRPREDWRQTVITVSKGSEGFDVSPDGAQLWTAASEDGMISIIDLASKTLLTKIDAKADGANRLKFTPDGKLVFITSLGTGDLIIYDASTQKEVKRIKVGHGAAGILMDEQANRAFVANSADNTISIVDLKTLTVTGQFSVGGVPDGMAWAVQK
jgi:YVTN family beta-propeller protein